MQIEHTSRRSGISPVYQHWVEVALYSKYQLTLVRRHVKGTPCREA